MSAICLIAARGGSKGVPKKNLRLLGNKPLIAYAIQSAIESKLFEHVVVSTENNEIASVSKKFGADIIIKRPKILATDTASIYDVIMHAAKKLKLLYPKFEVLCYRDSTVPYIDKTDIQKAMNLYIKSKCDGVHTVHIPSHTPYFGMYESNSQGYLIHSKISKNRISNRNESPLVYEVNGLYINSVKKLIKNRGDLHKGRILPFVISSIHAVNIDHEIDFNFAEFLYTLNYSKNN